MSRGVLMAKKRLLLENEVTHYHCMTRTAQEKFWLADPDFKPFWLDLIDFYSRVYYIKVDAFASERPHPSGAGVA